MKTALTFHSCGLNSENNILETPVCTCGCGEKASLILKNDKEVADFIGSMLVETDCHHCAIFAIKHDGSLIFGQKTDEDIICYHLRTNNAKKEISDMQKMFKFHCYGLLKQTGDESYAIIMD